MVLGDIIEASHVGSIARIRVKAWRKQREGAREEESGGGDGDDQPTNATVTYQGVVSFVSKLTFALQGCVEVDPDNNFAPMGASPAGGGNTAPPSPNKDDGSLPVLYRDRHFVTIQRKRVIGATLIDDEYDKIVEKEEQPAKFGPFADVEGYAAACASNPGDKVFRYQLLATLARMHYVPRVKAEREREAREARENSAAAFAGEGEEEARDPSQGGIPRAEAVTEAREREPFAQEVTPTRTPQQVSLEPSGLTSPVVPPLSPTVETPTRPAGHRRTVSNVSFALGIEAFEASIPPVEPPPAITHGRTGSTLSNNNSFRASLRVSHRRTESTGSAIVSVDPTRQELFDDFLNDEDVQAQWLRCHAALRSAVVPMSLEDAVQANQRDARQSQLRAQLGVHSMLQLLSEAKTDVEKLLDEEAKYRSSSSRRRLSPYQLRVQRIKTLFMRLFAIQSITGIILALLGGILFAQAVVTPISDEEGMVVQYSASIYHTMIPASFLFVLTGVIMAVSARWTGRTSKQTLQFIFLGMLLSFIATIISLLVPAHHLQQKKNLFSGKSMEEFFAEQAAKSSKSLCSHMIQRACSGWTRPCDGLASIGWRAQQAANNGLTNFSDYALLADYNRYCPQNCNAVVDTKIDMVFGFRTAGTCQSELLSSVKSISTEFVSMISVCLFGCIVFVAGSEFAFRLFFRTIAVDAELAAAAEREQQSSG